MSKQTSYLETVHGHIVYPWNPQASQLDVRDFANSLAMQPRFSGHLPEFYCIGDHSINVMTMAIQIMLEEYPDMPGSVFYKIKMQAFMHDWAEAWISDIPSPVKRYIAAISKAENRMLEKIYKIYKVDFKRRSYRKLAKAIVKKADIMVLLAEKEDITCSRMRWPRYDAWKRAPFHINTSGHWKKAKLRFLRVWEANYAK